MRLLSITSVRNEGPFLLEWLAYQRLIGITDFLIFSNDCDDGTDLILDALAQQGLVTHIRQQLPDEKSVQWQALASAWRHPLRKGADWILFSDVDEFPLISVGAQRLPDLIAAAPKGTEAIVLPWRLFGSSGKHRFEDQPVTSQFTRCAPYPLLHPVAGSYFKTLFRPEAFRTAGVHRPKRRKDAPPPLWVNADLTPMPQSFAETDSRISLIGLTAEAPLVELFHYSLRSVESFLVKKRRGLANRAVKSIDLGYWVERNFNSEPDTRMLGWSARLATEMALLRALPRLDDLHRAACDQHKRAFESAITKIEYFTLYAHCLHAGDSVALPRAEALNMLRRFQDVT